VKKVVLVVPFWFINSSYVFSPKDYVRKSWHLNARKIAVPERRAHFHYYPVQLIHEPDILPVVVEQVRDQSAPGSGEGYDRLSLKKELGAALLEQP